MHCFTLLRFLSGLAASSSLLLVFPGSAAGQDWPVFGRSATRNAVIPEGNGPTDWDVASGQNIKWRVSLGSETYAAPVVAGGRVYIGTNNGAGYLERYPSSVDLGCLLCFRESDGQLLWQYSAEKLPSGRVHDWPNQGLVSSPMVEGDRLWFVSNRHVVVCLDAQGFRDGENDGPVVDEPVQDSREADVVWQFDMIKELGVFPHPPGMGPNTRCSIAATSGNLIYVVTGNGTDEGFDKIPAPHAPSLVCLDKTIAMKRRTADEYLPLAEIAHDEPIYSSPIFANQTLYIATRSTLFAIAAPQTPDQATTSSSRRAPASFRDSAVATSRVAKPIFSPTPQDVVERMLELAQLNQDDIVVDLGSGDGRIVTTAALKHGARAIGYETDHRLVTTSLARARQAGVAGLVDFKLQDMYTADLQAASVATAYLYPAALNKLKPQFSKMNPGAKIVSHHYALPDVKPDQVITFRSKETGDDHKIWLYTVPLMNTAIVLNNQVAYEQWPERCSPLLEVGR